MAQITTTMLRGRWQGSDRWLSDGGARGAGRLTARLTRDGVLLYFQYFLPGTGKVQRVPLGPYDEAGTRGLSLVQARDKAAELAALYRGGAHDLNAHLEREREAAERARKAEEEAARRAQEDAQRSTLKQLLDTYIAYLDRRGKQSARDAKSIFGRHVLEAAPDLAIRKATDVSVDEFVGLIAKLSEAGKGRTAAKCRSYLRAAYSLAIRSRTDPSAPLAMRSFGITANPIASIGALSQFSRARDRVLSGPEFAAFLKRVEALPEGTPLDTLQLAVLLGGQRPQQLLRARAADVDLSAGTITLSDPKGARQQPRRHVLPLTADAKAILKRRLEALVDGEPLFSTDAKTCMRIETISVLVADIAGNMLAKEREAREPFQLRDIRRTAETMLASLGVSSDVRAQLQSHGLGGVQQRHYDRHEYMLEKRQALEKWRRHLEFLKARKSADVVPLTRRKARGGVHQDVTKQ